METSTIPSGEFPFPLTHGPNESPFLTWLRNHSNYLAVRGFLDYFRMAAVLIRGIFINNLALIPTLLAIALAMSLLCGSLLTHWDEQAVPAAKQVKTAAAKVRAATTAARATEGLDAQESPAGRLIVTFPVRPRAKHAWYEGKTVPDEAAPTTPRRKRWRPPGKSCTRPIWNWIRPITSGDRVAPGSRLIRRPGTGVHTFGKRFAWQVPPRALLREMTMRLNETYPWVNLSDGGHIENLGAIELLRRRCKFIVIGDGEADPNLHFYGLATLLRTAYIDLGIDIDICLDELRLEENRCSKAHVAVGKINYPGQGQGYLLYLKSSVTGDEHEVISEYRHRCPEFPHESTADQFFDEGQFEAYRALGNHLGLCAIEMLAPDRSAGKVTYAQFVQCFEALWQRIENCRGLRDDV